MDPVRRGPSPFVATTFTAPIRRNAVLRRGPPAAPRRAREISRRRRRRSAHK